MERYHCVIDTTRGWERWEEIDRGVMFGRTYFLMENAEYGDEVPCLIIDGHEKVVEWNWYGTLEEWFNEE